MDEQKLLGVRIANIKFSVVKKKKSVQRTRMTIESDKKMEKKS
jgi:hypothetical protein